MNVQGSYKCKANVMLLFSVNIAHIQYYMHNEIMLILISKTGKSQLLCMYNAEGS